MQEEIQPNLPSHTPVQCEIKYALGLQLPLTKSIHQPVHPNAQADGETLAIHLHFNTPPYMWLPQPKPGPKVDCNFYFYLYRPDRLKTS